MTELLAFISGGSFIIAVDYWSQGRRLEMAQGIVLGVGSLVAMAVKMMVDAHAW